MELPWLGIHCYDPSCQRCDFLSLTCECKAVFCSQHFNQHVMYCTRRPTVGGSTTGTASETKKGVKCDFPGCKTTSYIPIVCDKCQGCFCVNHRHFGECSSDESACKIEKEKIVTVQEQYDKAKLTVDSELDKSIEKAKTNRKSTEMANKVQLMRIKSKAVGLKTIPIVDRVCFIIEHPKMFGDKQSIVFVSKTWCVGRAVDAVASICNISNDNNKKGPKLRLFKKDNLEAVTNDLSDKIEDLMDKEMLVSGETLVLEYVD